MTRKSLRFAAIIRVSTERQAEEGESLRTQLAQLERDVVHLGGTIAGWYGGQEHATPGHEKAEIDRLLTDAMAGKFDAVIVAHADRWSRDNTKSREGLEVFKDHSIRFFIGTTESDLFNPDHAMFLGLSAVIGQYLAHNQTKKSILNRIERAKRNIPSGGQLPYGRTFDKDLKTWSIIPEKQQVFEEMARRYLAGESLEALDKLLDFEHGNFYTILRKSAGSKYSIRFRSKEFKIDETVELAIPPLLSDDLIQAVIRKIEDQKPITRRRGQAKHQAVFGGLVFCQHCGTTMTPHENVKGLRYYHHRVEVTCTHPGPKATVRADNLEDAVLRELFDCFGNPVAVQRAVQAAMPNLDKINQDRERLKRLAGELAKVEASRNRVVDAIADGLLTRDQAKVKLTKLSDQETALREELDKVESTLANVPTVEDIKSDAKKVSAKWRLFLKTTCINNRFDEMTWEERRKLALMVFSGRSPEGKRHGIYIEWIPGQEKRKQKRFRYWLIGRLIHQTGTIPSMWYIDPEGGEFSGGTMQKELMVNMDSELKP